ncbi:MULTISPECIES: hypothetical protein [Niastella]|uniref:Uncharacterized protein n=1 Tax=Niastella soli TaxID=2821487 RepID=A0ABS3YWV2_9BACT|nr:hypothetical protein [Niastella soli]MBO9202409.1 hypothetical protein [Niastella soli]
MKKLHVSHVLVLTGILVVSVTAVAFYERSNVQPKDDWTEYYWFDASGDYTWRQNTIDFEIYLTGYDQSQAAPFTLMEKGYPPAAVSGWPPQPHNPYLPAKKLYIHP